MELLGEGGDRSVGTPELLENATPRGIRECGERMVETGLLILNHMVQYKSPRASMQEEICVSLHPAGVQAFGSLGRLGTPPARGHLAGLRWQVWRRSHPRHSEPTGGQPEIFGWKVRQRGDGNLAFDDSGSVSGTWVKESDRTPDNAFRAGAHHQNWLLGAANTGVLIGSSLTMALAVWAAQTNRRKATAVLLLATLLLGGVFLGVKAYEYSVHIHEGLFPGHLFTYVDEADPALTKGVELFMLFYFGMTGLHALHMVIGAGLLIWMIWRAWRGDFGEEYYGPVEVMGLYWHFVDIVWIFLFPLLYLLH